MKSSGEQSGGFKKIFTQYRVTVYQNILAQHSGWNLLKGTFVLVWKMCSINRHVSEPIYHSEENLKFQERYFICYQAIHVDCIGCSFRLYLEAFIFKLVTITRPQSLSCYIINSFYRACCIHLCMFSSLIFAPMVPLWKSALPRKLRFHQYCGNCKCHTTSIWGLIYHLWRVLTTRFVFFGHRFWGI